MGGWMADNPELADELAIDALPEPWKRWVEEDFVDLWDVPNIYLDPAFAEADRRYWDNLADHADNLRKAAREKV